MIHEKEENKNRQHMDKELKSLGIDPKRKNDLNDKEELETLVDNVKQSMYQDYKTAYSNKGNNHEEEAKATVNP